MAGSSFSDPGSDDNFKHLASSPPRKVYVVKSWPTSISICCTDLRPARGGKPQSQGICSCMWILFVRCTDSMGVFAGGILLAVFTTNLNNKCCPTQRPLGFLVDQYWTFLSTAFDTFFYPSSLLGCGNSVVYTTFCAHAHTLLKLGFWLGCIWHILVAKHGIVRVD